MEIENLFKNAGEPWTAKEDAQLYKLYNNDMLDVMEISRIHNRAPGGIISRLKKNNYIVQRQSARGYNSYKNSDLYKQIVESNKDKYKKDLTEKSKKITVKTPISSIDNVFISINKCDYLDLKNDVTEMKIEVIELKTTIKELVEMMKAVYEFEDA
jgi:hypothetical protein